MRGAFVLNIRKVIVGTFLFDIKGKFLKKESKIFARRKWTLLDWTGTDDLPHEYCLSSRVLMIFLTGTDEFPHGYYR